MHRNAQLCAFNATECTFMRLNYDNAPDALMHLNAQLCAFNATGCTFMCL